MLSSIALSMMNGKVHEPIQNRFIGGIDVSKIYYIETIAKSRDLRMSHSRGASIVGSSLAILGQRYNDFLFRIRRNLLVNKLAMTHVEDGKVSVKRGNQGIIKLNFCVKYEKEIIAIVKDNKDNKDNKDK